MGKRFAFDLGTSSIGWAIYDLDTAGHPVGLSDAGVRLFSDGRDPKTGEALGAKRRAPKAARRRRDRTLQRRRFVEALLTNHDLLPPPGDERDEVLALNPYPLRAKAPCEALSLHELGRVIWHLNQRRGFKSNRKTDGVKPENEKETGKIAAGGAKLDAMLIEGGFETFGQFLAARQASSISTENDPVRVRLAGEGTKATYDFYPQRAMLEAEFDAVWAEQAKHHPSLTEELKGRVRHAVFHQRPLKPVMPGRCTFFPDRFRLSRGTELAQEFIVLSQLGHLRIDFSDGERPLYPEERDRLAEPLLAGRKLTWKGVRKLLDIGAAPSINLKDGGEKALHYNLIPARFEGTKKRPGPFPGGWAKQSADVRASIIERLEPTLVPGRREDEQPRVPTDDEVEAFGREELGLDEDRAAALSRVVLPDGHLNVSGHAAKLIVEKLRDEVDEDGFVVTYAEATGRAGLHHSSFKDSEFFDRLPPYNRVEALQRHIGFGTNDPADPPDTRYGKIANPTVHIALNQLRRVVNDLIDRHGKPDEIVLEVARDLKQSPRQKEEASKRIDANRKANDRRRDEMARAGAIQPDERGIRDKLLRMRLWEELGPTPRCCPYTGETISMSMLLSDAVEVEHILPYARTLDDSLSNKTVALVRANRRKRNLTPAEAAERMPGEFDLDAMRPRARAMPPNKRWRFEPDAMERYEEVQDGFAERQLHATGYLSRLSRAYLAKLFPSEDEAGKGRSHVWVVTGQLTAKLRRHWGLNAVLGDHNRKNRDDHRHHAIDACVIGVTDRRLLMEVARVSGREAERGADVDRVIAGLDEPYEGFVDEVRRTMDTLLVSRRADHGRTDPSDPHETSGKLHDEFVFGKVRETDENAGDLALGTVVRRRFVTDLNAKQIDRVRDGWCRKQLQRVRDEAARDGEKLAEALARWSDGTHRNKKGEEQPNPRRIRVLENNTTVPIHDKKTGRPYKHVVPAENVWVDIIETPEGVWKAHAVDVFAANTGRGEGWASVYPDASFVMRLRKGDTVQLFDEDGENRVKKVVRIEISANRVRLAEVNQGGDYSKRHADPDDPFVWDFATISKMRDRKARRVRFTPAGRMKTIPYGTL